MTTEIKDATQPTDSLLVIAKDERESVINLIWHSLEHGVPEGVSRESIFRLVNRLEG